MAIRRPQPQPSLDNQLSGEPLKVQQPSVQEVASLPESSSLSDSSPDTRAIEHYREVIQLGVAARLTQQRIHSETVKKQAALAGEQKRTRALAQLEMEEQEAHRKKMQHQLYLATTRAQEAQADLAHERAQQAALETQWLLEEERRRKDEAAFHKAEQEHLRAAQKKQDLLDLHATHQFVSTVQARQARASQRRERQAQSESKNERRRPHGERDNESDSPSRPSRATPAQNHEASPSAESHSRQHNQSILSPKETFQKAAQEQKERFRDVWKK